MTQSPAPQDDLAHFANRLRKWRLGQNLVLKQAAASFGVTEATWSRWENGERLPSASNLRRLSEFIGVPICCFFYPNPASCPNCTGTPTEG